MDKGVIVVLLVLLVLSGCGFLEFDEEISAAVKAGDPGMCAKLEDKDGTRIDRCYDQVAQQIKDPSVCDMIGASERKDGCFSGIAIKLEDRSLCSKIAALDLALKTECLTEIAMRKDDENICLDLKNTYAEAECMSEVARSKRDMSICDNIQEQQEKISCQVNTAVSTGKEEECDKIESEASRQACKEQIGERGDKSCSTDMDCTPEEICSDSYCSRPDCTAEDKYCRGDKLEVCHRGEISVSTCIYGCKDDECITREEKEKLDEEKEKEDSCDENYAKCLSDVKLEHCEAGKKAETLCEYGCRNGKCSERPDIDLSGAISGMKEKQEFAEVVSGPYMQALDMAIERSKEGSEKAGLEAYKEFLGKVSETYGEAVATLEDLEIMKRIFLDQYHPSMDIENMDVGDILDKSLTERLTDAVTGLWPSGGKKSIEQEEQEQAEEQLRVYEAMLERKGEIEFLKKSRLRRIGDTVTGIVADKISGTVKEKAEEMAEAAAGTAFYTVTYLGDALETVQDEAKNMMFTGLIKAYDRRRSALEEQYPQKSNEEIHRLTVEQVEDFPYSDAKTGVVIAKYGNLLANEDCTAEGNTNQLCVDRHAFWVAMDKSYQHLNSKKMFDRWIAQVKSEE